MARDVVGNRGPIVPLQGPNARHPRCTVVVHGLTSCRQTWDPVTTLLAEGFTCVRLDLRGHGLISPLTKNPNLLRVRGLLGDTHAQTKIETPDLAAALKGTQRREERELCEQLRLQPRPPHRIPAAAPGRNEAARQHIPVSRPQPGCLTWAAGLHRLG